MPAIVAKDTTLSRRQVRRTSELRRNLRSIMFDGAAFSVMVGIGETYVPAFALALGLGEVAAGLVATVPMLAGGMLQLASPWAIRSLRSHRRWVVACASFQAISVLLLLAVALAGGVTAWLVFVPATLYWAAGLATGPAWNTWVEDLVPKPIRPTFFARRVRVSQVGVLVGLVMGGLFLRFSASIGPVFVFAVLFGIAALSRIVSVIMLVGQSEPRKGVSHEVITLGRTVQRLKDTSATRLVVYLLAVQVAVFTAGPYFTPYMLTQLELSYLQYMMLLGSAFLGKVLALPWAGAVAKRAGASRLLWIGGIGIVPLSGMWLISDSFAYLIALQILGGMAWAAYELAMFLLFFEAIPRENRVGMLTLYNLGNSVAMVAGALVGAIVMSYFDDGRDAYLAVFALSAVARAVTLFLAPRGNRGQVATPITSAMRTIAVRLEAGSLDRPILPTMSQPVRGIGKKRSRPTAFSELLARICTARPTNTRKGSCDRSVTQTVRKCSRQTAANRSIF